MDYYYEPVTPPSKTWANHEPLVGSSSKSQRLRSTPTTPNSDFLAQRVQQGLGRGFAGIKHDVLKGVVYEFQTLLRERQQLWDEAARETANQVRQQVEAEKDAAVRAVQDQLQKQVNEANRRLTAAEAERNRALADLREVRSAYKEMLEDSKKAKQERDAARGDLGRIRQERDKAVAERDAAAEKAAAMQAASAKLESALSAAKAERDAARGDLARVRLERDKAVAERDAAVQKARAEVAAEKDAATETVIAKLESALSAAEAERDAARGDLVRVRQERNNAVAKHDKMAGLLWKAKRELQDAQAASAEQTAALAQVAAERDEAKEALNEAVKARNEALAERDEALGAMREELDELKAERDACAKELAAVKKARDRALAELNGRRPGTDLEHIRAAVADADAARKELQRQLDEAHLRLATLTEELCETRKKRDELDFEVAELRLAVAQAHPRPTDWVVVDQRASTTNAPRRWRLRNARQPIAS